MGCPKLDVPAKYRVLLQVVCQSALIFVFSNFSYYPFGLEWGAPTQELPRYRNAYNDKERTPYTKYLDFGARSYIKSANVFDGPDPIASSFPSLTSINYAANRVPNGVDLHGLQFVPFGPATFTAQGFDKKQHRETVNSFLEAQGNLGLVIVDEVPYLGEANSLRQGDYTGAMIGVVPFGKQIRRGFKALKKFFKKVDGVPTVDPGLGNQFKDKTVDEVNAAMEKHVETGKIAKKYEDPISGSKSYQNTASGYSYNVDTGKSGRTGKKVESSHIDVNYPNPKPKNIPKKKLPIKDE